MRAVASRRPGKLVGVNWDQVLWTGKNDIDWLKSDKNDKNLRENPTNFWKIGKYPTKMLFCRQILPKIGGVTEHPSTPPLWWRHCMQVVHSIWPRLSSINRYQIKTMAFTFNTPKSGEDSVWFHCNLKGIFFLFFSFFFLYFFSIKKIRYLVCIP